MKYIPLALLCVAAAALYIVGSIAVELFKHWR